MKLLIAGYGSVGREFGILLAEKLQTLQDRYGIAPRVCGIVTGRHGGWIASDPAGIDPAIVVTSDWPRAGASPTGTQSFAGDAIALIDAMPADVFIELSTLNPQTGEPALSHVRAAFAHNMHVITANKGPVALAYHALKQEAQAAGVLFRFESTVMDGTPVINLAEFTLPSSEFASARAIINATSNFILSGLIAGQSFEETLKKAQAIGIAEADPSLDLDGWDAAVKLTVIANVIMGADIRPHDVLRDSSAEKMQAMIALTPKGSIVKQVATVQRDAAAPGGIKAAVSLEILDPADPLAGIGQGKAAIQFKTDTMGDLTIIEGQGTPRQTAFGVLADLITIAREAGRESSL